MKGKVNMAFCEPPRYDIENDGLCKEEFKFLGTKSWEALPLLR